MTGIIVVITRKTISMIIRFFIYGIIGWTMEIFWTSIMSVLKGDITFKGTTYLWMFPIYGMAIFLEPIHYNIRFMPWILRGGVWVILIWGIEYISGSMIRGVVGICPWDYSGATRYQINGLIRLDYAPAWFVAGLLFERIHDLLIQYLNFI